MFSFFAFYCNLFVLFGFGLHFLRFWLCSVLVSFRRVLCFLLVALPFGIVFSSVCYRSLLVSVRRVSCSFLAILPPRRSVYYDYTLFSIAILLHAFCASFRRVTFHPFYRFSCLTFWRFNTFHSRSFVGYIVILICFAL